MRRPLWLIYALGGGFGHLTRACALARAAVANTHIRILTNSPYAATVAHAMPDLVINVDQGPSEISREIASAEADRLIVDTFPRGLIGELANVLAGFPGLKVLVQRDLNPRYVAKYDLDAFVAKSYDLVLAPGETNQDGLGPSPNAVITAPWLIRSRHELLTRVRARQVLGLQEERSCIAVCAAGNAEELVWYGNVVSALLEGSLEWDVRCIAPRRPDACPTECFVSYWPAMDLYSAVDIVIGGGGYNTIYECVACGVPLIAKAWPRKYDRQHLRASRAERIVDTPDQAVAAALDLIRLQPGRRHLNFENGAADAVARIRQLLTDII